MLVNELKQLNALPPKKFFKSSNFIGLQYTAALFAVAVGLGFIVHCSPNQSCEVTAAARRVKENLYILFFFFLYFCTHAADHMNKTIRNQSHEDKFLREFSSLN